MISKVGLGTLFEIFGPSLQVTIRYFLVMLGELERCISESNSPNKLTFWVYEEGIYRTTEPFVMFLGHIDVPT